MNATSQRNCNRRPRLALENLEARETPASLAAVADGKGNLVVFNPNTGAKYLDFRPFDITGNKYVGQMSVALGDVNGDGVADLIVATRGTRAGKVKVFDGAGIIAGTVTQPTQTIFTAFPVTGYQQGLTLATADLNGDGIADIVVASRTAKSSVTGGLLPATVLVYAGTNSGAGGHIAGTTLGSFQPIGTSTDGVYVAATHDPGTGQAEVAISSANRRLVKIYSLTNGTFTQVGSNLGDGSTLTPANGDGQLRAFYVDAGLATEAITGALNTTTGAAELQVNNSTGTKLNSYSIGSGAKFFAIDTIDLTQTRNNQVMLALVTPNGGTTIDILNPTTGAITGTLNSFLDLTGKVTIAGF